MCAFGVGVGGQQNTAGVAHSAEAPTASGDLLVNTLCSWHRTREPQSGHCWESICRCVGCKKSM